MFDSEEKRLKEIVTPTGEDEFQIRYIRDENVGILTSRTEKSFFILDSREYWYDLIQEQYPNKQKCACKNDFFKISFAYTPRKETDDFRMVELTSECTECKRTKTFGQIEVNDSPSSQLFEEPISFCEQPKIKYKTYSVSGYWTQDSLLELTAFLAAKQPFIYLWYWNEADGKRRFDQVPHTQLTAFLSKKDPRYLAIYFSSNEIANTFACNDLGIYIDRDIWRRQELVCINAPIKVGFPDSKNLYYMDFCSEYLTPDAKIHSKNESFCRLTKELLKYSKEKLK